MPGAMPQVDTYRDMWERAMDEALEMLLQVNTEGAYFLGTAQMSKFGLKATFRPQVGLCTAVTPGNCAFTQGAVHGPVTVAGRQGSLRFVP